MKGYVIPAQALPLDGGGLGGGESHRKGRAKGRKRTPPITSLRTGKPLGSITPTLTRPHQGDGNEALPLDGGGLGGGDETTGLP